MKSYGKEVQVKFEMEASGNWNYKKNAENVANSTNSDKNLYSREYRSPKFLAVVRIKNVPTYWTHQEIFELLALFDECDRQNIQLINSKYYNSGDITIPEASFIDKLQNWLNERKQKKDVL